MCNYGIQTNIKTDFMQETLGDRGIHEHCRMCSILYGDCHYTGFKVCWIDYYITHHDFATPYPYHV